MSAKSAPEDPVAEALREVLISPSEADRNLEDANVVDGLFAVARAAHSISVSILPADAIGASDGYGGHVASLTEAVMSSAAALNRIADALFAIAEATYQKM